jgi:hypothetical protein
LSVECEQPSSSSEANVAKELVELDNRGALSEVCCCSYCCCCEEEGFECLGFVFDSISNLERHRSKRTATGMYATKGVTAKESEPEPEPDPEPEPEPEPGVVLG